MSSQLSSQKKPTRLRDVFAQAMVLLNKSQRTVKIYTEAMLRFCAFLQGMHPLKVSVNDIRAFLFYCKEERGFSPKYYNQTFYGLKMFYGIFLPDVPLMEQFCRIRTKENDIVILTRAEIEKMIRITDNLKHQASSQSAAGLRVRLHAAHPCGLRRSSSPHSKLRFGGGPNVPAVARDVWR